ncbi:MAG: hypothetical protein HKN35_07190 [Woeseia sp.]|nr:hypothetical protein [Woeseia sp.]
MQIRKTISETSPWFRAFVLISVFLCLMTVFARDVPILLLFNLRNESNFAALFSGMFLLTIALHAFDGSALNRASKANIANAWLMLSLVLVALSFDEIGSLHERVPAIGDLNQLVSLLPFALVFAAMLAYAVTILWRAPGQRRTTILICVGFALFASVALQEYIEHAVDWSANRYLRFFRHWFRPLIEEGTELLGMLVLLWAAMTNTRGILSRGEREKFPVFEAIVSWRRPMLVTALIGAPLIAYATVILPADRWGNGKPADWPAAAFFTLAAFAAARPYFISGRSVGLSGWTLVVLAVIGCASTILPPGSPNHVLMIVVLSAAAFLLWTSGPRYLPGAYVPAGVLLSITLAGAWLFRNNDFVVYTAIQYAALGFYWVNSSASPLDPTPDG